ncbi:MAG: Unknown protein [uncultured Sulfurovum sp.]|uniref:Uncharacterized protein n=1 Tax=uncultured Sulfurovum sp. TaxID=269237 RepID=A0A6S6U4H5_9BACT|nr:MAG: Unknown protein [uncultured Sulfurovum sp.]
MKYIYTLLTLLLIVGIAFFSFQGNSKKSGKADRIACHKKSVVFEKVYDENQFEKVKNALYTGAYKLTSRVQKSVYMKTRMFEYVDLKDVDKLVENAIAQYKKQIPNTGNKVGVDYYIYENDKADPGKKTVKSKLYAGYLHFIFSYGGKKVYAVQVDFMDLEGKDIDKSVECAIKSLVTL